MSANVFYDLLLTCKAPPAPLLIPRVLAGGLILVKYSSPPKRAQSACVCIRARANEASASFYCHVCRFVRRHPLAESHLHHLIPFFDAFLSADNLKGRQLLHTTYKMFMTAAGVEGERRRRPRESHEGKAVQVAAG